MSAAVCSVACSAQGVRACVQQRKAAPVTALPRVALAAGAASLLLVAAPPAMADADVALGAEVFSNNCGECLPSAAAAAAAPAAPAAAPSTVEPPRTSGGPPSSSGRPAAQWLPGRRSPGDRLLRRPLLRIHRPAQLMLLQAACHTGGQNSVIPERTLQRAALEQYLAGGFKIEAIETQVTNGKGAMPAWESRLSEEEIQGVAAYVFKQAEGNLW